MYSLLKNFKTDDSGAVTVDWVVLTAAIVGLGIAVSTAITTGAIDLSDGIWAYLKTIRP